MKTIFLRQTHRVNYLFFSFQENVTYTFNYLLENREKVVVVQSQLVFDKWISSSRVIDLESFHNLFLSQQELLLEILKYLNDEIEIYERYELLKSCLSEFEIIRMLLKNNPSAVIQSYKEFCEDQLIPLINIHIARIDETLKIRNHKSYVRKSMADKGLFRLDGSFDDVSIKGVLEFFEGECIDEEEFYALKQELIDGRPSHLQYYRLKYIDSDTLPLFFNILVTRHGYKIHKKELAKWIYRRFRRQNKKGEFVVINSERSILDKVSRKLTSFENRLTLNRQFKKS